jgi:hypothetical protein
MASERQLPNRIRWVWLIAAVCTIGIAAVRRAPGVTTLAIEGRSNENVSVAAYGSFVTVVWSASTSDATDIYAAVSRDGGAKFGAPVRVNSTAGEARAGGEQPPRVQLVPMSSGDPRIVVVWTAKGEKGSRLLMAGSDNGGKSFAKSEAVPGGTAAGNRGWESLAVDASGRAFALWLDHRDKPSELWFGSLDRSVAPKSITGGVCYCCKTSLVASGQNVYAVWRHVFPGNQRDIGFTMSRDGGKTFTQIRRVSEDKWQFDGCPENGPAIAVASDGIIHVAWVTPEGGKDGAPLALYRTWSRDGINFELRERVKTYGAAGHAQLVAGRDGAITLAWDEATANGRRVMTAHYSKSGKWLGAVIENGDGVYPALATSSQGTVVAWVRRGGPKTQIAVTTLP